MTEREFAVSVVQRLHDAGFEALWAGGCVRDELLGLVPKDYDVATNAAPEQVQKLFRRALAVGASFGVIEVLGPRVAGRHLSVEVATFRTDGVYSDGRRPDSVVFATAREDALRRDFTINGMFFNPLKGELIDYVGGQTDLHQRVLRAIGDPVLRFAEDKLRLLRAVRLATRFELTIEPATQRAIQEHAAQIKVVSAERIAEELRQLLVHPRRGRGARLLDELGLLGPLLPELLPLKATESSQGLENVGQAFQPASESGRLESLPRSLWEHVLTVLDYLGPAPSFPLAFAGLLHEIADSRLGRAFQPAGQPGRLESLPHVEEICLRLRLSNEESNGTIWLIENQQVLDAARTMRTCRLKQLLIHPGIHDLLTLYRADCLARGQSVDPVEFCEGRLREWTEHDLDPPPLITGNDLVALGLKPGPLFKQILDAVRDEQLDSTISTKEEALRWLGRNADLQGGGQR